MLLSGCSILGFFLHSEEHISQLLIGRNFSQSTFSYIQCPLNTSLLLERIPNAYARFFNMGADISRIAVSNQNRLPTLRTLCIN
ncbi:hypothetical protein AQ908_09390 [Burkholderia pseudomallei]|nr:hypothetical protein WJ80_13425 [Burkholderia ubonensis]ONA03733.1 hypothetical protein AQ874_25450 [Burkholderia pseudomallei]ONC03835.1 hypothetical protein AQ908_09390 [Burkholderia pseudomallei]